MKNINVMNPLRSRGLKKPVPLKAGDKAAILAPSSPLPEQILDLAVDSIEFLGLEPVVFPSCRLRHGYLAGTDKERAADINRAFADSSIKGIFCLRGGYGATRILPLLDYPMIAQNPKVFAGYSDITALHTVFNNRCGFVTFHSPMPNTGYGAMDLFSLSSLKANLFSQNPVGPVFNPAGEFLKTMVPGQAQGMIAGGNLSVLHGALGSAFEVDTKGKILFIEEVGELPYRLDKALTALALAGKFTDCAGIILGTFADCEEPVADGDQDSGAIASSSLSLNQIFDEVVKPFNKPTILNFRAGHVYPQSTIPMGAWASLDASSGTVEFF